jgi:hypothetical protein
VCIASLALAFLSGCGGGGRSGQVFISPQADYDYYFYAEVGDEKKPNREEILEVIDRLAGPGWATARKEILAYGKPAIHELIECLDRTEPTQVTVRALPGHSVPERMLTWPLGSVVYSVLVDFIGGYSDYDGALPPADKAEWQRWWHRNHKNLDVRTEMHKAPDYVRQQMEAARIARSTRFTRKISEATKRKQKERARKAEESRKREEEKRMRRAEQERKRREARDTAMKEKAEAVAAKQKAAAEKAAARKAAKEAEAAKPEAEPEAEPEEEQPPAEEKTEETSGEEPASRPDAGGAEN